LNSDIVIQYENSFQFCNVQVAGIAIPWPVVGLVFWSDEP